LVERVDDIAPSIPLHHLASRPLFAFAFFGDGPMALTRTPRRRYVNLNKAKGLRLSRRTVAGTHQDLGERSRWWVRENGERVFQIERFAGGSGRYVLALVSSESLAIVSDHKTLRDAFKAARRLYASNKTTRSASAHCRA
jgi:hypothetical protein